MTALRGTATFKRCFVGGEPDPGFTTKALRAISPRRFAPSANVDTVAFGWVPMTDPLRDHITHEDVFVGPLICLGFREDQRVVRAADIREEVKTRIREVELERERPLSRAEKAALKEAVVAELKAAAPIRRRVAELIWNPPAQEARLFGASAQMTEACATLFEKTFGFELNLAEVDALMARQGFSARRTRTAPAEEATDAPF